MLQQNEIIEMARQAGFLYGTMGPSNMRFVTAIGHTFTVELEAFAKLVADVVTAKEREACANICLGFAEHSAMNELEGYDAYRDCEEAIRARGQT